MKAQYLLEAIAAMLAAEQLSYETPPAEFGRVIADLTAARHSLLAFSGLYHVDVPVWHDDKPSERTDLHVSTERGDLDSFGRPLRPGR